MGHFIFERSPSILRKIASYSYDIAHALRYYKLAFEMEQERKLELVLEQSAKEVKPTKSNRSIYSSSRNLKTSEIIVSPLSILTVHICTKGHHVLKTEKDSIHFKNANALISFIIKHYAICKAVLHICGKSFDFDVCNTADSSFTSKLKSSTKSGPSLYSVVSFLLQVQPPTIMNEANLVAKSNEYLFSCKTALIDRHTFESYILLTRNSKFAYFYKESKDGKKYALFYGIASKQVAGYYTLDRYVDVSYNYNEALEFMNAIEVDIYGPS